jgi:uncharacterized protein with PIN domain
MLVNIRGESKQIKVTSVILERDVNEDELTLSMFFCNRCQNPVAQHTGEVINILPGLTPNPFPVLQLCKNCRRIYSFQGVAYI